MFSVCPCKCMIDFKEVARYFKTKFEIFNIKLN